jgi:integrase
MGDFVSTRSNKSIRIPGSTPRRDVISRDMEWSLYDGRGQRKYLIRSERAAFVREALRAGGEIGSFCIVLAFTGARVSEVLALTPANIDEANGTINIETLKRRKRGVIRSIPLSSEVFDLLDRTHHYKMARHNIAQSKARLWPWSRTTAWRRVRQIMHVAANPAHLAKPKALRHSFGAEAALNQIPITLIKKWMGHARLDTTEIYTSLVGEEERALYRLTWRHLPRELRSQPSTRRQTSPIIGRVRDDI